MKGSNQISLTNRLLKVVVVALLALMAAVAIILAKPATKVNAQSINKISEHVVTVIVTDDMAK